MKNPFVEIGENPLRRGKDGYLDNRGMISDRRFRFRGLALPLCQSQRIRVWFTSVALVLMALAIVGQLGMGKSITDGRTDGRTDQRMDTPSYRVVAHNLKCMKVNSIKGNNNKGTPTAKYNGKLWFT